MRTVNVGTIVINGRLKVLTQTAYTALSVLIRRLWVVNLPLPAYCERVSGGKTAYRPTTGSQANGTATSLNEHYAHISTDAYYQLRQGVIVCVIVTALALVTVLCYLCVLKCLFIIIIIIYYYYY